MPWRQEQATWLRRPAGGHASHARRQQQQRHSRHVRRVRSPGSAFHYEIQQQQQHESAKMNRVAAAPGRLF
eukprot:COSAG01_NODE_3296_length_6298_cov_2.497500_5_plen_71_part_00